MTNKILTISIWVNRNLEKADVCFLREKIVVRQKRLAASSQLSPVSVNEFKKIYLPFMKGIVRFNLLSIIC